MLRKVTLIKIKSKREGIDIIDAFEQLISKEQEKHKNRSWTAARQAPT
jgi:post-segregation antitoxin (ccd killing protein)